LFSRSVELNTEFSNISGLASGAKVRVSGLDAGEVLDIEVPPNPGARFRIRFRASSKFQPILRMNSVASILNDGLVGSKFLQVEAGTSAAAPVTDGATIPSKEPIEIADLLTQARDTVKNANDAVTDVRNGIDDTVKAVLELNKQTTEVIDSVGKTVDKFTTTGTTVMQSVNSVITNVRDGKGTVGKLLNDDKLYEQLKSTLDEGQKMVANFDGVSDDLRSISNDLKSREVGAKLDRLSANADSLTSEGLRAFRTLTGPSGGAGGLMAEVRETLSSANEAMSDFSEGTEALKRNFLFRGFFNRRGYFDLGDVTMAEYTDPKFLPDRQRVTEWLDTAAIFATVAGKGEQLSDDGKTKLDVAMTSFLKYSKSDPLIVEAWAGSGPEPERILRGRERAIMVSDYLMKKFDLHPNSVGIMPMNAVGSSNGQARDGISLVLFVPKSNKK
jgi:phospholipid/cholesterol/gamma-HCH transport system substrate-binding protein